MIDLRGLPRADGELRHAAERLARMKLEAGGVSVCGRFGHDVTVPLSLSR